MVQGMQLSFMDGAGIDVAITSISTPGVHMGSDKAARDLARRANEIGAQLIQDRPERFGGFAALPLPDVEACRHEVEASPDLVRQGRLDANGLKLFPRLGSHHHCRKFSPQ